MRSNTIGGRIEDLRKKRGETQMQLAAAVGRKSRETVNQWESNTREVKGDDLIKLAKHFEVTTDYLLGLEKEPVPKLDLAKFCEYTGLSAGAVDQLHNAVRVMPLEALDKLHVLVESDDHIDVSDHSIQFGEDGSLPLRTDAFNKFMVSNGEKFIEMLSHIYYDCVAVQHLIDELQTDNRVSPDEFNALEANLKREKSNLEMSLFKFSRLCNVIPDVFGAWNLLEPFERKVTVCLTKQKKEANHESSES